MIEQPETTVVSFDFFDTLVKRRAVRPVDMFPRIGERLRQECLLPGYISARRFAQHREAAERAARDKALRRREVTLEQIYAELAFLFEDPAQGVEAARIELAVERSDIFANPFAAALLSRALELGRLCVICSDTYFSAQQLRILHALPPQVRVFASSEHGTGKADTLFDVMLELIARPAAEIVHFGDSHHADVEPARRRGMRAMLLPDGNSTTREIVAEERKLLAGLACPAGPLHRRERTHGTLTSLRHAALLQAEAGEALSYRGFGAAVLGPAILGYLRWVQTETRRDESSLIVGLAREGLTLLELYDAYVGERPTAPLYVSRATTCIAGLAQFHSDTFAALVPQRQPVGLDVFADRLGLHGRDFPAGWRDALVSAHDPRGVARMFEHIDGSKALRERVQTHGLRFRARLSRHLRNVLGELDDPARRRVALLDVGWGGSIQARLAQLFDMPPGALLGLYLALNDAALVRAAGGLRMGGYLFDGDLSFPLAARALRSVEVFEQVFTPAQGSVVDYTEQGEPILAPDTIAPAQREQAAQIRRGVRDFCETAIAQQALSGDEEEWLHASRAAVTRFCLAPLAEERRLFAGWMHDDSAAGGAVDPICPAVFDFMSAFLTPAQLLEEGFQHTYWPLAVTSPDAGRLMDQALAALRGGETPDVAATGSGVSARVRFGHGAPGETAAEPEGFSGFQEVLLNLYHRGAITWPCRPSTGQFLDLEFKSQHSAMIAVDGLVLRSRLRNGGGGSVLIEGVQLRESVAPGCAALVLPGEGAPCLALQPGRNSRLMLANPWRTDGEVPIDVTVLLRVWGELPDGVAAAPGVPDATQAGPPAAIEGCMDVLFDRKTGRDDEHLHAVLSPSDTYAIQGWLLDAECSWAPSEAWLVLERAGDCRRIAADQQARPDLGAHFGRVIAGMPGLLCRISLAGLQTGQYRIGWAGRFGARICTWYEPRILCVAVDGAGNVVLDVRMFAPEPEGAGGRPG